MKKHELQFVFVAFSAIVGFTETCRYSGNCPFTKITAMTFIEILLHLAITFNDISFVTFIIYFHASYDTSL